ncbi:amidase [Roseomonas stagni]|uniref:Amidase n=1 Tax=Falsiroseomonas algicola TaxID=2716930 RepID=A0A6M1LQR7_9PROT|nr:amidase [Falsiroseomonas algicola]NGM22453.1 amidase [Falsiroseomonas algicola]
MMMTEAWRLSATELAARYRAGTLRPSEALASVLARIAQANPAINAIATLDEAGAKEAAAAADARFSAGKPLSALDGVPVSIKDNITQAGLRCAWGSELYLDYVSEHDETPVARLRAAGAVLIGKTNVSEFTLGRGNIDTKAFGVTRNPYNPALTSGASTGGGAAAVATGFGPVTLGTDGGGSIRRPACHNGLVGLKPSTGRVARRHGLPIILDDAEVIGPIARTVDDLAATLSLIQGPLAEDRLSIGVPGPHEEPPPPKNLRVLYIPQFGDWKVDAPVAESCAEAARNMAALGHRVTTGKLPVDLALFEKHWPTFTQGGLAWLLRGKEWRGKIGAIYEEMADRGATLTAADYIDGLAAFREVQAQFAIAFQDWDVLMTPTAGALPWPADQFGPPHNRAFTGIVNAGGLPGMNVPCAPSADGLPIGFQLIGPYGADWLLVALARQYEAAHPWADRWPPL